MLSNDLLNEAQTYSAQICTIDVPFKWIENSSSCERYRDLGNAKIVAAAPVLYPTEPEKIPNAQFVVTQIK
jgi:hypothetical protein